MERDVETMQATAKTRVEDAVRFMTDSPWPAPESVTDFVYSQRTAT